jgi:hypothetical protein
MAPRTGQRLSTSNELSLNALGAEIAPRSTLMRIGVSVYLGNLPGRSISLRRFDYSVNGVCVHQVVARLCLSIGSLTVGL